MGVRKHKHKIRPEKARHRLIVSKRQIKPWTSDEQTLAYFVPPFHLRAHTAGGMPLSRLNSPSSLNRYFHKPLKLYRGKLKEVKEYSTA